jgi:aspartyl/glutamyl-tRNA(Asn/Gln) amidotransferase C subunit
MAKITAKEVQKTAKLARIELTKKEEEKFAKELGDILDFFTDIQEAQSGNVEKFDYYQLKENRLRVDEILEKPKGQTEGIKENFPKEKDGYLKVKSVLKKSNS